MIVCQTHMNKFAGKCLRLYAECAMNLFATAMQPQLADYLLHYVTNVSMRYSFCKIQKAYRIIHIKFLLWPLFLIRYCHLIAHSPLFSAPSTKCRTNPSQSSSRAVDTSARSHSFRGLSRWTAHHFLCIAQEKGWVSIWNLICFDTVKQFFVASEISRSLTKQIRSGVKRFWIGPTIPHF